MGKLHNYFSGMIIGLSISLSCFGAGISSLSQENTSPHSQAQLVAVSSEVPSEFPNASGNHSNPISRTSSLTLKIHNIEARREGHLLIAIFNGKENWLDLEKFEARQKLKVLQSSYVEVIFEGLKQGQEYAVAIIHDENANGKLDMQYFPPKPKEGVGVSNNTFRLGPPAYSKARIVMTENTKIDINLRY